MPLKKSNCFSRRQLLIAPAAIGIGGTEAARASGATSGYFPFSDLKEIAAAAKLSVRDIYQNGLINLPIGPHTPLEVELLRSDEDLRRALHLRVAEIVSKRRFDEADFLPIEYIETPKQTLGLRRTIGLLQPQDCAVYLALAILAAPILCCQR